MAPTAMTREVGPDPLLGKVLDERYRIEEPLGEGGIGRVYKARHLILGRMVALKVLLAQYENIPVLQQRFQREAEALAALSHPNIVTVTDFGVAEGMPYLVMELLEGQDLASMIAREPIPAGRAIAIVRQVLRALAFAHSRDLVHRDLKPHNVFVRAMGDGTDHVEVLDFGLARFVGGAGEKSPRLTKAGALLGTPAYMAPEQASGEAVDGRADLYATGVLLFETLTGRRPFESGDPGELLRLHLTAAPPALHQADSGLEASEALEGFVQRALRKAPKERFQSAAEMLQALDALGPEPARRIGPRPPRDQPVRTVAPTHAPTRAGGPNAMRAAPIAAPRPASETVALPKSRWPLLAGLGCAAGVLVGGAIAVALVFSEGWTDGPIGTPPEAPENDDPPTGVDPLPTPPPIPAFPVPAIVPWRDPFGEGAPALPPELAPLHARVESDRPRLSEGQLDALREYSRAHPDDPRPHLIRAHHEGLQRHLTDAIESYEQAYGLDPSVRGDGRMLPNLLEMSVVEDAELRNRAQQFVVDAYGAEALLPIEGYSRLSVVTRAQRQRLRELRDRIEARAGRIPALPNAP